MLVAPRRKTRVLHVGNVKIGGDNPIVVQSMTTADTRDAKATLAQIEELAEAGCEIVRIAVPDRKAAAALPDIVPFSPVPLIADIHFEHTLALKALDAGIHGLRLNPGNIRKHDDVVEVVNKAKERMTPIRIGVNFGSVPPMPQEFVDEMAQVNATQAELRAEQARRSLMVNLLVQATGVALPAMVHSSVAYLRSALLVGSTFMGTVTIAMPAARTIPLQPK